MKRFLCWLTGGHKYRDENIKSELVPDDVRQVILSNECIKCGEPTFFIMNVDRKIKNDIIRLKKEMGCGE